MENGRSQFGRYIYIEKEFDSDGRVSRVCNPYRSGETKVWTTNTYDTASRTVSVTLPDSSTVATDYGISTSSPVGVTKTITDQAGKKRKGYTDVSGNMVRVVEDPASSALVTDYTFDTLGNLRKTAQGSQYRYFMHDSLGRLLYAKQVEQDANSNFSGSGYTDPITSNDQWSVKYVYDDNGNITSTTDANNNSVTAYYDHLNRIYNRDYSDSTPDVDFYYDGKGLSSTPAYSNGKTTKVTSSASETKYMSFDIFGHLLTHRQTTDGTDYDTAYSYNIAGALIEETYPSGRVVKNTLDDNGDLSQVQSKKNASSGFWQYAKGFDYDKTGALTKMQLGNGRWETYSYNNRQQVTQIGLGVNDSSQDLLKLEYKYDTTGNTDNNGAMLEQKITVPTVGATSGFTATQTYAYDALNRLSVAEEKVSGSTTWKQTFTIDQYGNRRFDAANTTTLGSCTEAVCNPTISTGTNRISSSGYSFDANGNLTIDANGDQFFYDAENHQKQVKDANGNSLGQYFYDGEGRRVKKISDTETTVFVYDGGGQLMAEYSTELAQTAQVSYLTQDHLGSPRVITNENGAVTSRKDYSAFGEETISAERADELGYPSLAAGGELRKGYTGYEKDSESGLDYAQARYYNSIHGRYTSVDPMIASATIKNPQTFNRYSYVLNSPYKFTDPLGLLSEYTTGACGNRCPNSDGGIAGYSDNYDSGQRPGIEGTALEIERMVDELISISVGAMRQAGVGFWVKAGKDTWNWSQKCERSSVCTTAVAGVASAGVAILGSDGPDDKTYIDSNSNGMIDLNDIAAHHNANFMIDKNQNIAEEFASPQSAVALFNASVFYGQIFTNDAKLVFTASALATGKGCVYSNGSPCHHTHDGGNSLDIRYMGSSGQPVEGSSAYLRADVGRMFTLLMAFSSYGYKTVYTGQQSKFGLRPAPKAQAKHRNHIHIARGRVPTFQ